jgi:hypothetical protein
MSDLHPSIVALVSLAANIASNHPKQGLCQIDRLKTYGVSKSQIDAVVEIARHIRDEAAQSLDAQFDVELASRFAPSARERLASIAVTADGACCTPTQSGQSCC